MNFSFLIALVLCSCSLRDTPAENAAFRAVLAPSVGKLQTDQCEPYARDLCARLRKQGLESRVLAVYYTIGLWDKTLHGHAICLYRVEGRLWAMDNQMLLPVRVREYNDDREIARWVWAVNHGNPWDVVSATTAP